MVPLAGIEPAHPNGQQILSLSRLPVPPQGQPYLFNIKFYRKAQYRNEANVPRQSRKYFITKMKNKSAGRFAKSKTTLLKKQDGRLYYEKSLYAYTLI